MEEKKFKSSRASGCSHLNLTGASKFTVQTSQFRRANVELVVVLEVKASVRVAKLRSMCWTSHNEVWPGAVKVFRRETLIPEEETGELCMRTGPSLYGRGAWKRPSGL
jgi:hypothetical protein